MKDCPYCKGFSKQDLLFVEVECKNFPNGIAVECQNCGMRGMVADQGDAEHETLAIVFWNDMVNAIEFYENNTDDSGKIWDLARDVRQAQKNFYRLRKKVTKTEHDSLLSKALNLEVEMDNAITAHFNPQLQEKLL
jgi:hypothetical protein